MNDQKYLITKEISRDIVHLMQFNYLNLGYSTVRSFLFLLI